jgi:cytochrome P450
MRRLVTQDIVLSNGFLLKKGTRLHVDSNLMRDSEYYNDPETWKPFRFAEMRENEDAKKKASAQLVSTSIQHLGFGCGSHACPGRFFAEAEVKVILSFLLINYDWKLAPGSEVRPIEIGLNSISNSKTRVLIRKRGKPEINMFSTRSKPKTANT